MANASVNDSDFLGFSHEADIFDQLELTDFFPDKLSIYDVRKHDNHELSNDVSNVKWILIRKLIGLNSKARDLELESLLKTEDKVSSRDNSSSFDVFVSSLMEQQFSPKMISKVKFHPLDILFAIFCCCTPMLKQLIVSKMFTCRLAVPLISLEWIHVANPVIWTWPLRGIIIEGRSGDLKAIQESLVKTQLKVVSFIRIGKPSFSKSKLLNEILSNQYNDTFFNRDCPLGTTTRSISNGLIEASWFLPARDECDIFPDVIMFLNLRGEGITFATQCKILQKISSVVVLIVEFQQLTKQVTIDLCTQMHEWNMSVVYALDCNGVQQDSLIQTLQSFMQNMKSWYTNMRVINIVNQKGSATIKEELREVIRSFMREKKNTSIEALIQTVKGMSVTSDENESCCLKGKEKANNVMASIRNKRKEDVMPLQKPTWIQYTQLLKQQRKASEAFSLKNTDQLEQQLTKLRKKQHSHCNNLSDSVKILISTLDELEDRNDELQFFLSYLKFEMDEISRTSLPELIRVYKTKWKKWQSSKGVIDPKKLKVLKQDVDKAEHILAEAPFGYEHLIRELGQLYECTQAVGPLTNIKLMETISKSPRMVAHQLYLGQPFEIMDGDAANVPTTWVNAVFQELQAIIGNVKVLSISVLGIQSSGKSTLLNTMFGLQFAVSAGRCTRGVFLQLLPLPDSKYPFEYLLVIDTEGLRAPELSDFKHEHDNELATFVIGLGDITIINVKGENTAEVNDVLQIAIHAFLRLKLTAKKRISLHQSCIFVHQNVPAKDAKDKMMHGRKKFVENLDTMTKEAAEQENMPHISSFNKVMDFDSEDHVFYFSDLWYGDPPMAPINQGYSANVEMLKSFLFSEITAKRETYLTLSDTRQRVLDLWEGILTDDFVFNFRNSLEVKAYNSIESIFMSLKWDLETFVFEFVYSTAENMYAGCQQQHECELVHQQNRRKLKDGISKQTDKLIETWKARLNESPWKEIVVQWKENKINRLKQFADEQEYQGLIDLDLMKEKYLIIILNKQSLTQSDSRMWFTKAQIVADKLKGNKPSDPQLRKEFETMWKSCVEEFELKRKANDINVSIGEQIQNALLESYSTDAVFLKSTSDNPLQCNYEELTKLKGSLQLKDIASEYISVHSPFSESVRKVISTENAKMATLVITNKILEKVDVIINEKKKMNTKFNILYVKEIFKIIEAAINEHNSNHELPFSLVKMYKAMLQIHVSKYAEKVFSSMNERYEEINGWHRKLQDYRTTLWNFFTARVEQRSEEVSATNAFCKIIEDAVKTSVSKFLPLDVQNIMLEEFAHTKFHLMMKILDTLIVSENFADFHSYISQSKIFAQNWIENYTEARIFSTVSSNEISRYAMLAKRRIDALFESLTAAIQSANRANFEQCDAGIDEWIEHCIKSLKGCLPISSGDFTLVRDRNITDITSFSTLLVSELPKLQDQCLNSFLDVTSKNVMWVGSNPYKSITSKLWGCSACCPFCLEPCQKSDDGHFEADNTDVHTCIQHRPAGVAGLHYVKTLILSIDVCNFKVQSNQSFRCSASQLECRKSGKCVAKDDETGHPYREYKHFIPSWDIAPSTSIRSSDFWSWFTTKYIEQLCQIYGLKQPDDIPESWKSISKTQARESLRKAMN